MKHTWKKLSAWLLTAAMLLTMLPAMAITASAAADRPTQVVQLDVGGANCNTETHQIRDDRIYLKSGDVIYELTGTTDKRIYMNGSNVSTVYLRLNNVTINNRIYYSSNHAAVDLEIPAGTINTVNRIEQIKALSVHGEGTLHVGGIQLVTGGTAVKIADTTMVVDNSTVQTCFWSGECILSGTADVTVKARAGGYTPLQIGDLDTASSLTLTDTAKLTVLQAEDPVDYFTNGIDMYGSIKLEDESALIAYGADHTQTRENYGMPGAAIIFGSVERTLQVAEKATAKLVGGRYGDGSKGWATMGYLGYPNIVNAGYIEGDLLADSITNTSTGFILGSTYTSGEVKNDHIITKAIYTVKYDANGGSGKMDDGVAYDGYFYQPDECLFTPPAGMRLKGWATSPDGAVLDLNENGVKLDAHTTLYAIWDVNTYKLSWVVDGVAQTVNVAYGAAITAPADPAKKNYTFVGWDAEIPATMPARDLTFTAVWKAIPENTVAPAAGGTVVVDTQTPTTGDTVTITPVAESGMQIDTVAVFDAAGDPVAVVDNGDGTFSYVQPVGVVTISVTFKAIPRETMTLWLPVLARLYMTSNPIMAIAGEGGSISDEGVVQVKYGRNHSYVITPDEGYVIADVLVNGKSVGAVSEYTFKKVRRPQVIEVVFAPDPDAVAEVPVEDSADPMYTYDNP